MSTVPPTLPAETMASGVVDWVSVPAPIPESGTKKNDDAIPAMLAHADRCWKAEEVNATRIATRANLVLSGVTAVLGLKLFGASAEIRTVMRAVVTWRITLFWGTAMLGLFGLVYCLWVVLEMKPPRWFMFWRAQTPSPPSSQKLFLTEELASANPVKPKEHIDGAAFENVYAAALDLHNRNRDRSRRIDIAQVVFFWSAFSLFISLSAYAMIEYHQSRPETQTGIQSAP